MYNPRLPHNVQLSQSLSPEEVSQAWQYLVSLPQPSEFFQQEEPPLPSNLRHLSDADWFLLGNLLNRELHLKSQQPLH